MFFLGDLSLPKSGENQSMYVLPRDKANFRKTMAQFLSGAVVGSIGSDGFGGSSLDHLRGKNGIKM